MWEYRKKVMSKEAYEIGFKSWYKKIVKSGDAQGGIWNMF